MNAKISMGDRSRAMEIIVAVVAEGSFSAAGRLLELTPSAISRAVDRTEARLGVRLFLRSTRSLSLTVEGRAYLHAARRILGDLAETEQAIADQGSPRGRLRISSAQAYGRLHVAPLLGEFVRRYPDIMVDISLADQIVDVAAGHADVAIRFGPLADTMLTARKLGDSRRVIVAAPSYLAENGMPRSPADLLDHNCLHFNFRRTEPVWPFRDGGRDFSLRPRGNIEASSGELLAQLAVAGVGIVRVGAFSVETEIASGALVPVLEAFNPGDVETIHALFAGGPQTPARVRVFVDYLAEQLARGGRDMLR